MQSSLSESLLCLEIYKQTTWITLASQRVQQRQQQQQQQQGEVICLEVPKLRLNAVAFQNINTQKKYYIKKYSLSFFGIAKHVSHAWEINENECEAKRIADKTESFMQISDILRVHNTTIKLSAPAYTAQWVLENVIHFATLVEGYSNQMRCDVIDHSNRSQDRAWIWGTRNS